MFDSMGEFPNSAEKNQDIELSMLGNAIGHLRSSRSVQALGDAII